MSLYPHHREGPHVTVSEAFEQGVKLGAEQERKRSPWQPNTNAQGLAVSAAIQAAKEEGRREEQARIIAILRATHLRPERVEYLCILITGKASR